MSKAAAAPSQAGSGLPGGNPLGWKEVVKVAGLAAGLKMMWAAYEKANRLTWKDATESAMYEHWLNFCRGLVDLGVVPAYLPEDQNGDQLQVPSKSPQVHCEPPTRRQDAQCLQPLQLRGLTLRNRIVRAAAFDGESENEMIATHVDQAKGGVGMTTVAYCCISPDGRTFDEQLVMEQSRRQFLERLTSAVHSHGAAISAQLTHGGSFADRETIGKQQIAPSAVFNPAGVDFPRAMTAKDCNRIADAFAQAALLAKETGFDCIELHCGHGYLLSQFLSPASNVRTDEFGGTPEKRAAFPAECLKRCRAAVGPDFPIIVKLNMHDGMSGGLELRGAAVAARILADNSADGFVMTGGFVSKNAFYMLRGSTPQAKLVQALPHTWKKLAMMVFGPLAVPSVEYEDCFFRDGARYIMREIGHRVPVCLMGGVNSFAEMEGAIREGFGFVQIARALIREPDLVNRIEATLQLKEDGRLPAAPEDVVSNCVRCNMCVIATVDPAASFGCPFQRMDARRRAAAGEEEVMSVEAIKRDILKEHTVTASPVSANWSRDLGDIEDLMRASSRRVGKF